MCLNTECYRQWRHTRLHITWRIAHGASKPPHKRHITIAVGRTTNSQQSHLNRNVKADVDRGSYVLFISITTQRCYNSL